MRATEAAPTSSSLSSGGDGHEADVIIVGGGPAGLSTGMFLRHAGGGETGRPGARVIVLEKEHYPRDKFCAGGIGARGDRLLADIGVTIDVPSVHINGVSLAFAQGTVSMHEGAMGRVVRRIEYDHALARVARERGVLVREGTKVTGIAVDKDGVTVESSTGTFRGRVLVGADGVGSVVRRAMGLRAGKLRAEVVELDTERVASDPAADILHFDASDHALTGYAWDFPTLVDGQALVCRGVYHLKWGDGDCDIHALLRERLAARGLDIARYRLKRYAERGFDVHEPFATGRVMLVGEAAGIDAFTGEGIAQAIAYGAFAGPYLAEKLAVDDLQFDDFEERLVRSPIGVELSTRARFMPLFFGKNRARVERFLLRTPSFVSVGLQHFAGRRLSRRKIAQSMLSAAWRAAREAV